MTPKIDFQNLCSRKRDLNFENPLAMYKIIGKDIWHEIIVNRYLQPVDIAKLSMCNKLFWNWFRKHKSVHKAKIVEQRKRQKIKRQEKAKRDQIRIEESRKLWFENYLKNGLPHKPQKKQNLIYLAKKGVKWTKSKIKLAPNCKYKRHVKDCNSQNIRDRKATVTFTFYTEKRKFATAVTFLGDYDHYTSWFYDK